MRRAWRKNYEAIRPYVKIVDGLKRDATFRRDGERDHGARLGARFPGGTMRFFRFSSLSERPVHYPAAIAK